MFLSDFGQSILGTLQFGFQTAHLCLTLCQLVQFFNAVKESALMVFNQSFGTLLKIANRDVGIFAIVQSRRHGDFRSKVRVLLVRMIEGAASGDGDRIDFHVPFRIQQRGSSRVLVSSEMWAKM